MAYRVTMESRDSEYKFVVETAQEVRTFATDFYRVTVVEIVDENLEVSKTLTAEEISSLLNLTQ